MRYRLIGSGAPKPVAVRILAVLERDPGEQAEAIAARGQCRLEPILLPRPTLSERPQVGIRGIGPSPPAQPVEGPMAVVVLLISENFSRVGPKNLTP